MGTEDRLPGGSLRGLAVIFAALFALGLGSAHARAETRSLKLYFLHTGEKAEIAFKKDGKYIPSGLEQLNRFLRDWRRNEPTKMDPHLFDLVWEVYQESGSHDYIHVVSGYRSPATNAMLRRRSRGVAKYSQHMLGKAMDFFLPDVPLAKLRRIGLQLQDGGVGYYPTSGSPFVHMDVGSVRHWPRMSRKELLAVFPQGKTLHIPSDGKPLPGYDIALANYQRRMAGQTDSYAVASLTDTMGSGGQSKRKGRGLLARLFGLGGGADAEEDVASEADTGTGAVENAVPEKAPSTMDAVVVSLPDSDVPIPTAAPRPPATLAVADASAQSLPADKLMLALDMPAPSGRPAVTAGYPTETGGAIPALPAAAFASPAPGANDDQIRNVLLATLVQQDIRTSSARTEPAAYARARAGPEIPAPTSTAETGKLDRFAVLPQKVPAPEERGATAAKEERLRPTVQMASLETGGAYSEPNSLPMNADSTAVRTAPRQGKPGPGDEPPAPRALVVPVDPSVAEWAFHAGSTPVFRNSEPDAQSVMYTPPTVVLTMGFAPGHPVPDSHRFSGQAVTFLSVAKFSAKD